MNVNQIVASKHNLRKQLRYKRDAIDVEQKARWDALICKRLWEIIQSNNAKVVHTYLPIGNEVNLMPLISQMLATSITVVCPKTLSKRQLEHRVLHSLNELEEGPMHTFHPNQADIYTGTYDVIIVPGLAFDYANFRLGYGGGYYDAFLSQHPEACKVGAFYPFQEVESVPKEPHDQRIDKIVLPI